MPAAHNIYAEQLRELQRGHPLYHPEPRPEGPVEIGDVGYTKDGAFRRLFNITRPANDRVQRFGVPDSFTQLDMGPIDTFDAVLEPGPLHSGTVSTLSGEAGTPSGILPADASFHFRCTSKQGAVLMLESQMIREEAVQYRRLETYLMQHCQSWHAFTRSIDIDIGFGDLMLVTECSKTASWSSAVYSNSSTEFGLSFSVGVSFVMAGLGGSTSLEKIGPVERRRSQHRAHIHGTPLPKNHSVFIKAYRLGTREAYRQSAVFFFMKALRSTVFRGNIGSKSLQSPPTSHSNRDTSTIDVPTDLLVQRPHEPDFYASIALLGRELEENTDSECVVLHDNIWCSATPDSNEAQIMDMYTEFYFSDEVQNTLNYTTGGPAPSQPSRAHRFSDSSSHPRHVHPPLPLNDQSSGRESSTTLQVSDLKTGVSQINKATAPQVSNVEAEFEEKYIGHERQFENRLMMEVNVLLLGQSESGKSTTMKQFQLIHPVAAFKEERNAWRLVIYLNLVQSIFRIMDIVLGDVFKLDDADPSGNVAPNIPSDPPSPLEEISDSSPVYVYNTYKTHLHPLIGLRSRLKSILSSDGDKLNSTPRNEVSVSSFTNWTKGVLFPSKSKGLKTSHSGTDNVWWEDPDDPGHTLHAIAPVLLELWHDESVRLLLRERNARLKESSGFYLDDISRITAKKYMPTDADILKARLVSTNIMEYTFSASTEQRGGVRWRIYDMPGSRNHRQEWAPYLKDVSSIIFLAPISAFDQVLVEDPRVNRIEDSLLLWKEIITNPLLTSAAIILFLNKCDLLEEKLGAGVRLNQYMLAYGDRPNDYASVSRYFQQKFIAIYHSFAVKSGRKLYTHLTAVTDIQRTTETIQSVCDVIIDSNVQKTGLL